MGCKQGCVVRNRTLYVLALIFCSISALGQDQTIGPNGEGAFIAGLQGIPVRVLNEANSWSQPLVVFKNSKIELIIPDIRTASWAQSYASAFKKEGTYFTYIYIYGVQSHRTIRETLYVNTRTKIAVIIENALTPPTRVDLCKPDPQMPIDRITAIVKNVSDSFHGQSLDDVIAEQSYTVARMAECSGLSYSQDCTLSEAEYRAKHPRYPRAKTPTEILLAQIAPMTARQPNDICKGVPTAQNAGSSPAGGKGTSQNLQQKTATALLQDQPPTSDFENACNHGNIDKCYSAGRLFELGQRVPQDYMLAYKYFKQACDGGNVEGCNELGFLFANGFGVAQDYQQAYKYGKQACDGGLAKGCFDLGAVCTHDRDCTQALEYFAKACNGGIPEGCNQAASYSQLQANQMQALKFYKMSCDDGDSTGCKSYAHLLDDLLKGTMRIGTLHDYQQATLYNRKACELGEVSACSEAGFLLSYASTIVQGAAPNNQEALRYYNMACEGGDLKVCFNLGSLFEYGHSNLLADSQSITRDSKQAYSFWKKACNDKYVDACTMLHSVQNLKALGVERQ